MIILIGLGNPGQAYVHHRHNVGFQILDKIAEHYGVSFAIKKEYTAACAAVEDGQGALLVKPLTFMNGSGSTVYALKKRYPAAQYIVIHDDIDIPLGEVKCSINRGAGGHNGVQSIIDHMHTKNFIRIRVGVRPIHDVLEKKIAPPHGFETFLLSDFAPFEKGEYEKALTSTKSIIHHIVQESGIDAQALSNRYNGSK